MPGEPGIIAVAITGCRPRNPDRPTEFGVPGATWTAAGIGRHPFDGARRADPKGGHRNTGREDTMRLDRVTLAPSNAVRVARLAAPSPPPARHAPSTACRP